MRRKSFYKFKKDFVIAFVETAKKHSSLSAEEYLLGMSGHVLLDFAIALKIDEVVLARNPHGISTKESSDNLICDLVTSILEKVGR